MMPLIDASYILVVDSSQIDSAKLNGKVVIAWHKEMALTVSRLRATTIRMCYSLRAESTSRLF